MRWATLTRLRRRSYLRAGAIAWRVRLLLALLSCQLPQPRQSGNRAGVALLTDVQAQDVGDFDRVTFTFEGGVPTILDVPNTSRGPAAPAPTSHLLVDRPVGGAATAAVTMGGASSLDTSVDPAVDTYTGPSRFVLDLPKVVELVQVQDFEAMLGWVIGLRGPEVVATAQVLSGPTRVVVDIPHDAEIVTVSPSFTG